jgi:hypothetical protein
LSKPNKNSGLIHAARKAQPHAIRDTKHKRTEKLDLTALIEASEDAIIEEILDGTIVS